MTIDLPAEWRGFAVALVVTMAIAGAGRLVKRGRWAGAAAGLGLVAGFAAVLGVISASPRHLAERLPALVLIGLLAGLATSLPRPVLRVIGTAAGVLLGGWWMAGAPLHPPDLLRAAPQALSLAVAMAALLRRDAGVPAQVIGWAVLSAGLAGAAAPGPYVAFALAGFGALVAGGALGGASGPVSRLPLMLGLVGVAAVPVMARAVAADVAAAAAPGLALLAGPLLAGRIAVRAGPGLAAWLGPAIAAVPAVAAAFMLAR